MKPVRRILPTIFLLISINVFADTIRFDLNTSVGIDPNFGIGDNVGVLLSGQGVGIFALGGTPTGWFDGDQQYFPGEQGLGNTTIFWDTANLQIGPTFYGFDQFDLDPTNVFIPTITFPANGKDFTVTFPWTWVLDGTIVENCPTSGCGFLFVSKPGKLSFSYFYLPETGAYFPSSASFVTTPEPSTITLIAIGLGAVGWKRLRSSC